MAINLKFKKILRPSLILGIVLVLILLFEAYQVYSGIYLNLNTDTEFQGTGNIVRIDLNAYDATIQQIDANANYSPPPSRDLPNPSPF